MFKVISSFPQKNFNDQSIPFHGLKTIIMDFSLKYEVQELFVHYCDEGNEAIIKWDKKFLQKTYFSLFLNEFQKENLEDNNLITLTNKKENDSFSFFEFCQYLFNPKNSIFNPEMTQIYQDMNHPLYEYFVNSSHNTYLLGNQFTGESSTQAYINAFNKGCRCVEIDCWDGPKNNPAVTHGNTLTSKISFESVVKCINDYGFKNNPYPIILSIENHCCITQQNRMVEILEDILGDKIWKPNLNNKFTYASPNDLKYKILLKGKGLKFNPMKNEDSPFKIKIGKVMVQSFVDKQEENIKEEENNETRIMSSVPLFSPKFDSWVNNRFCYQNSKTSMPTFLNCLDYKQIGSDEIKREVFTEEQITQKNHEIFLSFEIATKKVISPSDVNVIEMSKNIRNPHENFSICSNEIKIPNFNALFQQENEEKENTDSIENKAITPIERNALEICERSSSNHSPAKNPQRSRASNLISFLVSPKSGKRKEVENSGSRTSSKSSNDYTTKKKTPHKISLRLHESLALFGYKLKTFEKQIKAYEITSISEDKLQKLFTKEYINITEINKKSFTRSYPKSTRVDSSNYDPVPGFSCGVQFIALNFQTNDMNLGIYLSKFHQNGGIYSGYVLKPELLRDKFLDQRINNLFMNVDKSPIGRRSLMNVFTPGLKSKNELCIDIREKTGAILELQINLISGFQIRNENGKLLKEPIYVEIFVKGLQTDENFNKKYTSTLKENHFHPIFEKISLNFSIVFPELAFVVFAVYKKSQSSKPIAFYSIPVECIRTGYRRVPLMDFYFQNINDSYLFCKIQKKELKD